MMNYLRSVLMNNYTGSDLEYIMISAPRLTDYELLVIDFAIDLLEHYGKEELFKRTSYEEDKTRLNMVVNYRTRTILQYNVQRKYIYHMHLKLLKVVRAILERISVEGKSFSAACFVRIGGVEDEDSDWEVYRRRMGLRHYFKELKMNMGRIQRSKEAKVVTSGQLTEATKKAKKRKAAAAEEGSTPEKKPTANGGDKSGKKAEGAAKKGTAATGKKKAAVKK
jgi:hypothetical protein